MNNSNSAPLINQHHDQTGINQLQTGNIFAERYLILGAVGIGGMSTVYKGRDMHFPKVTKLVAIKEMFNRALDPMVKNTIVKNFEREANILASLNHPGIPRIYDYFTRNERSYLILEFINGADLETLIHATEGLIPIDRVISWAIELCGVLSYLHQHQPEPIIFRDMKPSNIMITTQDHVTLVDFGIAKPFQVGKRGTMIGTEGYSPPEQYRGEASPQTDIYALGATLHHVFTGHDPRTEAPFSFQERPLQQVNPNVSPELERVISKAVEYEPVNRYETAEQMKAALVDAAKKTGFIEQAISRLSATEQSRDAIKRCVWEYECKDEIRGSATCHKGAVFFGCYDNHLYALDGKNGNLLWKYAADAGIVSKPVVYEDTVFFGSEDFRLHAVNWRNGRISWTYFTNGPIRSSPVISGGHVFVGSDDGYLHAVNAITGRLAWRFDAESTIRSTPTIWNDMVLLGTEGGDFFCVDFSGSGKWRFKARRSITSSAVVQKDIVHFGSIDCTVYSLEAKNGWVLRRFRLVKPTISTPFVSENLLYIGSIDGSVYCIDHGTSKEIWRFPTMNQVTGSPVIYQEALYFGSVDGFVYCLDPRDGNQRWKFQTAGAITGTPAAAEDMIYIGSTDQRMYALMV